MRMRTALISTPAARAQKSREPPRAKQGEKQPRHRTHAKTPALVGVISAIAAVGWEWAGGWRERRQLGARREQSVIKRAASFIFQPPSESERLSRWIIN
jgi:hypothetical protein